MKAESVSVLSIGSELLDGRVLDANANFVGNELSKHGLRLRRIITCADDMTEIKAALQEVLQYSNFVLLSGGLGPTSDDMTREAVAECCSGELVQNETALKDLKCFYAKRGRSFDNANLKQVHIPKGAALLRNTNGTAAGFALQTSAGKTVAALPGVPSEFREMFLGQVLPLILEKLKVAPKLQTACFRVFWIPEAQVGRKIESCGLPADIIVSYRATFPEVQVLLKREGNIPDEVTRSVEQALGVDSIYSRSLDIDLPTLIQNLLLERKLTLSVAESCSGGLLGKLVSDVPGSSECFLGGVISYSNELKKRVLGVPQTDLEKYGAVSEQVAKAMADGARKNFASSLALSITGIAGPTGGSAEKPVGTFYLGLAGENIVFANRYFFASTRPNIRRFSSFCALDLLRRYLLKLPLDIAALHA